MSSDRPDSPRADQATCTAAVLDSTPDAALVSNLGVASYVLAGVEDRARNCYLWGSMGVTTPVGLGLALQTDEQVTVLDGDGSTLLSLGALATVARHDPSNLVVVVFDNGEFATTDRGDEALDALKAKMGVEEGETEEKADFSFEEDEATEESSESETREKNEKKEETVSAGDRGTWDSNEE